MPHRPKGDKEYNRYFRNICGISLGPGGGYHLRADKKTRIFLVGLPSFEVMLKVFDYAKTNNLKVIPDNLLDEVLMNAKNEVNREEAKAAAEERAAAKLKRAAEAQAAAEAKAAAEAQASAKAKAIFSNVLKEIVFIGTIRGNPVLRNLLGKSAK